MQFAAQKECLEVRFAELDQRVHHIEDELDEPNSRNWDEAAVEREDDEVLQEMGNEGLKEMRAIKAALARIEDGSYGVCANCGATISPERLAAVPYTLLCRHCAT